MSEISVTAGSAAPDKGRGADAGAAVVAPLPHYVSTAPFDAYSIDAMTPAQERFYRAPPILLMWWRLRRHRVAVVSGVFLLAMYVMIAFSELVAPYALDSRHVDHIYAPPQAMHIFDNDGRLTWPYVTGFD